MMYVNADRSSGGLLWHIGIMLLGHFCIIKSLQLESRPTNNETGEVGQVAWSIAQTSKNMTNKWELVNRKPEKLR